MRDAWIVEAVRTPIGRYGGALASVRPDDLAAAVHPRRRRAVRDRPGAHRGRHPRLREPGGRGQPQRRADGALLAGLPVEVGGQTVNRLCGVGLQAINSAAHAIAVGDGDVFIAGGVESMTRAPYVMAKPEAACERGDRELYDTTLGWRFTNPQLAELHYPYSMGETAENVAERWEVGRDEQDAFALESQQQAVAAIEAGRFDGQIVPDHGPPARRATRSSSTATSTRARTRRCEALARLRPAFREGGTVTAGNSSRHQRRRGGGAPRRGRPRARELGLRPLARVVSTAVAGVDPAVMGIGPVPASRKALERAGLERRRPRPRRAERGVRLASRSPASTSSASIPAKVNVNGGAIALGHPLGHERRAPVTMLVHELRRTGGRYGLATMCIGVGQGIATVVERIDE